MRNALLHKLYSFCIIICLSSVVYTQYQQELRMIELEERMDVLYEGANNFFEKDSMYKFQMEKALNCELLQMKNDIINLKIRDNSPLPLKKA